MRTPGFALALLALTACASNGARLDAAWATFQTEQERTLAHARAVVAVTAERARAAGDDALLVRVTTPPASPVARLCDASALAAVAYLAGDAAGIEKALRAVRATERDLRELERAPAPPATPRDGAADAR